MGRTNRSAEKSISCTRVAMAVGWLSGRCHARCQASAGVWGGGEALAARTALRAASMVSSSERASLMLKGSFPMLERVLKGF